MRIAFLTLVFIVSFLIAGCAGPMDSLQKSEIGFERTQSSAPASPYKGTAWHVVLDAVGNEQRVFDNFVNDFGDLLKRDNSRIASLRRLSASGPGGAPFGALHSTLTDLKLQSNDACMIYLTGHGVQNRGIFFSINRSALTTGELEDLLRTSPCAGHPTVVVVSACFSGIYMKVGVANENRIVMTASAPELTSFGCSDNRRYTFFDQCFIDEWHKHSTWEQLGDGLQSCVSKEESARRTLASRPQFFYGRNMRDLDLPKSVSNK